MTYFEHCEYCEHREHCEHHEQSLINIIIILFIILITSYYFIRLNINFLDMITKQYFIESNVIFLDSTQASNVLDQYFVYPKLTRYDRLKNIKTMDFTDDEQHKLLSFMPSDCTNIHFIKIKDYFGYNSWFTLGDKYIIIPANEIKTCDKTIFQFTISHELEHIKQRINKNTYRKMYKELGLIEIPTNNLIMTHHKIIKNPDDYDCWYIYPISFHYYFPCIVFEKKDDMFSSAIYIIKLRKCSDMYMYIEQKAWPIKEAPTKIKESIVNIWRMVCPEYTIEDLEENGYSPNEVMAMIKEKY